MTYAYLKKYSGGTDKNGFYIDGPNWTLQTSFRADRFFRQSVHYHDDTQLPLTVVKTLVHLEEAETGGRKSKEEILDWFPRLSPKYCDMSEEQLNELEEFIAEEVASQTSSESSPNELDNFLRNQTPIDPPQ